MRKFFSRFFGKPEQQVFYTEAVLILKIALGLVLLWQGGRVVAFVGYIGFGVLNNTFNSSMEVMPITVLVLVVIGVAIRWLVKRNWRKTAPQP